MWKCVDISFCATTHDPNGNNHDNDDDDYDQNEDDQMTVKVDKRQASSDCVNVVEAIAQRDKQPNEEKSRADESEEAEEETEGSGGEAEEVGSMLSPIGVSQVPLFRLLDDYSNFLRTVFRKLSKPSCEPTGVCARHANALIFGLYCNFHFVRAKYKMRNSLALFHSVLDSNKRVSADFYNRHVPQPPMPSDARKKSRIAIEREVDATPLSFEFV